MTKYVLKSSSSLNHYLQYLFPKSVVSSNNGKQLWMVLRFSSSLSSIEEIKKDLYSIFTNGEPIKKPKKRTALLLEKIKSFSYFNNIDINNALYVNFKKIFSESKSPIWYIGITQDWDVPWINIPSQDTKYFHARLPYNINNKWIITIKLSPDVDWDYEIEHHETDSNLYKDLFSNKIDLDKYPEVLKRKYLSISMVPQS